MAENKIADVLKVKGLREASTPNKGVQKILPRPSAQDAIQLGAVTALNAQKTKDCTQVLLINEDDDEQAH